MVPSQSVIHRAEDCIASGSDFYYGVSRKPLPLYAKLRRVKPRVPVGTTPLGYGVDGGLGRFA